MNDIEEFTADQRAAFAEHGVDGIKVIPQAWTQHYIIELTSEGQKVIDFGYIPHWDYTKEQQAEAIFKRAMKELER